MLRPIDRILSGITMYWVVLYSLMLLAAASLLASAFHAISYPFPSLIGSLALLFFVTYGVNELIARALRVPANPESAPITALILFFVLMPPTTLREALLVALAGTVAMASKYVLAIRKQHVFNPAAVGAVTVGIPTGIALWWVATPVLLPVTLIAALLVIRKVRRFWMFAATVAAGAAVFTVLGALHGQGIAPTLWQFFASWPIVFFAAFMVTEPFTAPGTARGRLLYGAFIGALSSWPLYVGIVYSTPELTLVIANVFSFAYGLRRKLVLTLARSEEIAQDTHAFHFSVSPKPSFRAGQYLEWTLPHADIDARGIRRYFTIASSPTEPELAIGVKFAPDGSSFKKRLLALQPGDRMYAAIRGGDFVLPHDPREKLAFIAGGIGVTPFRSMVKQLVDEGSERDAVLLYASKTWPEVAYRALWESARKIGLKTVYVLNDATGAPEDAATGFVTAELLNARVPDWKERTFYLSGPDAMVQAYKKLLRGMGVASGRIRTDYFPGF